MAMAALFYFLLGAAKLAGPEPKAYLNAITHPAIRCETLLMPYAYSR
jgi:hypothetical protein